jgi:hypothetical protein
MNSIKTLKLEYNDDDIYKMKIIDKSLYIYYNSEKTNEEELLKQFGSSKFKLIPREYALHISTNDEDIFNELFGDYKENVIIFNKTPRFIAKLVVKTEEEYLKFLNYQKDNIRIKPYLQRLQYKDLSDDKTVKKPLYKYPKYKSYKKN